MVLAQLWRINVKHMVTVKLTSYGGQPQDLHLQKGDNDKIHVIGFLGGLRGPSYEPFFQRHPYHRASAQARRAVVIGAQGPSPPVPPSAGAAP